MSSSFGGGGSGEIKYIVSVDTTQAIQQLQSVGQQFQTMAQTGGQSAQQLGQLPQTLDDVTTSTGKFSQANADMAAELQATDIQAKEATRSTQSFGQVLKNNITNILQIGTGILGLVSNYSNLQRAQLAINKAQTLEANQRRLLGVLTRQHTIAVQKYGASSQEALDIENKINILQSKHANTVEQLNLRQEQLTQSQIGFGFSLAQTGLGIAQAVSGFKSYRVAQDAATGSTKRFGTAALATWGKVLLPIAAVVGAIELAKHNIFGLGDVFTQIRTRIEAAVPGLKEFFDILVQIGEGISAFVEGRFGDFGNIISGVQQNVEAAGTSIDGMTDSVTDSGKAANEAEKAITEMKGAYADFIGELKTGKDAWGETKKILKDIGFGKDAIKKIHVGLEFEFEAPQNAIKNLVTGLDLVKEFHLSPKQQQDVAENFEDDMKKAIKKAGGDLDMLKELVNIVKKNEKNPDLANLVAGWFNNLPQSVKDELVRHGINPDDVVKQMGFDPANITPSIDQQIDKAFAAADVDPTGMMTDIDPNLVGDEVLRALGVDVANPFQAKIDKMVEKLKTADYSQIPAAVSDKIKEEFTKKPINLMDFITGAGGKIPQGSPGSTQGGTSHTIAMFINDNFVVPISQAWTNSQERIKLMMEKHPIIDKIEKGDILGAHVDASINGVTILQGLWEGIVIPYQEQWTKIAAHIDVQMLDKPLIEKIAKLDILGDAVKQTMQLDKWFLEDIATPVGKAWIDAVQIPVQAYIKLENIFKDITLDNIMGSVSAAIGGLGKWFDDNIAKPARNAWDDFISGIVGYFQGHTAGGAGDDGFPGGGFDFGEKGPWTPPHGANKITSNADIDRMMDDADSGKIPIGTVKGNMVMTAQGWIRTDDMTEWDTSLGHGEQFDRWRSFQQMEPKEQHGQNYAYGTPQEQLEEALNGWFYGVGGLMPGSPGSPVGDLRGSDIMADFLKKSIESGKSLDSLGNSTDTLGGAFLGSSNKFLILRQSLESTSSAMNAYKASIDTMKSRMNLSGQYYGTPYDASGKFNTESYLGQGSIIGGTSPRQESLNDWSRLKGQFLGGGIGGGTNQIGQQMADINKQMGPALQKVKLAFDAAIGQILSLFAAVATQWSFTMNTLGKNAKSGGTQAYKSLNQYIQNIAGVMNLLAKQWSFDMNSLGKNAKSGGSQIYKILNQALQNIAGVMNELGTHWSMHMNKMGKNAKSGGSQIYKALNQALENVAGVMNTFAKHWSKICNSMIANAKSAAKGINSALASIKNVERTVTITTVHKNQTQWVQHGFHGIVNQPTIFGAGEAGPERVDVTPLGQTARQSGRPGGAGHGQGNDIVMNAVFQIKGNDIINDMKLSKKVKMTVGANRDRLM